MQIPRDRYLKKLIHGIDNGMIKIVTGIRGCGKSHLVFKLFVEHLRSIGTPDDHIISIALDDERNRGFRDSGMLMDHILSRITDSEKYYVLIDEIPMAVSKAEMRNKDAYLGIYGVLNKLLRYDNVDTYVTGSNSKFISKDVRTEFRGRGDVIEMHPLSFGEYYNHVGGNKASAFDRYCIFGGMPAVLDLESDNKKKKYLSSCFGEVYFKDIADYYSIRRMDILEQLTDALCSSLGTFADFNDLSAAVRYFCGTNCSDKIIGAYLDHLNDFNLFHWQKRSVLKYRGYFEPPVKYYCEDIGLCNARIRFSRRKKSILVENIIFNELVAREYSVNFGVVEPPEDAKNGNHGRETGGIDFVVDAWPLRYYIQLALDATTSDELEQRIRPLLATGDFFPRMIVTDTTMRPFYDDLGIKHAGLYDLLLDDSLLKE
ncbi:MAG: ATP-binding protein [Victivallaceae bacterium]|nr:ATP-binding protein [Victivallaceae bacterium]